MLIKNVCDIEDLIEEKLIRLKDEGDFWVAKYQNKVFYDHLWEKDARLQQVRGHTFSKVTGDIVIRPFDKVFNLGECGASLSPSKQYLWSRKVNGFMGAVTVSKGVLFSTTGTMSSQYVDYIKESVDTDALWMYHCFNGNVVEPITYLFEIVHKDDPHIVKEAQGAYLLAARYVKSGDYLSEKELDLVANVIKCYRPDYGVCVGEALELEQNTCQHEGYVVKDLVTGYPILKIKSNSYLMQKFFARGGFNKMEKLWYANQKTQFATWEEEWLDILDKIKAQYTLDQWVDKNEQDRLKIIKELL